MSKILVDTIDTRSGTSTLTLGSSNAGTIALGSGDVQSNMLYPAFHVFLNGYSFSYVFTYKLSGNITLFDVLQCLVGWLFISKFPIFTF